MALTVHPEQSIDGGDPSCSALRGDIGSARRSICSVESPSMAVALVVSMLARPAAAPGSCLPQPASVATATTATTRWLNGMQQGRSLNTESRGRSVHRANSTPRPNRSSGLREQARMGRRHSGRSDPPPP